MHLLTFATRLEEGPEVVQSLQPTEDDMTGPIIAFAATDRGRRRSHNEDAFLLDDALKLYVVADGMGGARGGEVASQMAVTGLREALLETEGGPSPEAVKDPREHPLYQRLPGAVQAANRAIWARSEQDPRLTGMGTTLTGVSFAAGFAFLVHVGDSRAYRVRGKHIEQLSVDHTYIGELVRNGTIRPDEAEHMPWRHVLARAVGVEERVDVDAWAVPTQPGDLFVLCSDGLANVVSEGEIRDAVLDTFLRGAPDRLVRLANARGGPDNITVVVACVNDEEANDDSSRDARKTA